MTIRWDPSEWADTGFAADLNGIYADVYLQENGAWAWIVKPSGRRCEYPELFDCGDARTEQSAKNKAEVALKKADRSYRTMGEDGW